MKYYELNDIICADPDKYGNLAELALMDMMDEETADTGKQQYWRSEAAEWIVKKFLGDAHK